MNDQRQVIFTQRMNILKQSDISDMLKDFLNELSRKLLKIKVTFTTSSDEKSFLAGIKNFTGNAIEDENLKKYANLEDTDFIKKIIKIFNDKREEKINLIGLEQYQDLEKKIFLQILDFSWRAHLQYLEQLRQVIGLRSYGQKDPLSEFKKEAFTLFEILLEKVKTDVIKFLLNMNLVLSKEPEQKKQPLENNQKIGRNDKCSCGSGKKYKHCCGSV
jgi:preprotein translocase subunit SecA